MGDGRGGDGRPLNDCAVVCLPRSCVVLAAAGFGVEGGGYDCERRLQWKSVAWLLLLVCLCGVQDG